MGLGPLIRRLEAKDSKTGRQNALTRTRLLCIVRRMAASKRLAVLAIAALLAGCAITSSLRYLVTRHTDQSDDYHGVKVADP